MRHVIATADHDAALRRMAREQAMPGWIRLAFCREPDWAAGEHVLGHVCQTVVALDAAGEVVGCGVRAIRHAYVNGRRAAIGYLCGLRSLPRIRGSLALAQSYRHLRRLHEADRLTPAYLTTIVEANTDVARLLTSRRSTLPAYLDRGRFITSAILPGRRTARADPAGIEIRSPPEVPLEDVLGFLGEEGPKRQFFPVLEAADLASPRCRGLAAGDFRAALRNGAIVGVVAAWDQTAFRQTVVASYAPLLGVARPLLNAALRLSGRRPLPRAGQCLNIIHVAFACVRDDDPAVFAALLERMRADHWKSRHDFLVIGLHERDPLRAALARFPAFHYASRLYLACWEDGEAFCESLRPDLIPHLETAML